MSENFMMMTKEDALKRLAEITGRSINGENEGSNPSADTDNNEEKIVDDVIETGSDNPESTTEIFTTNTAASLEDLQKIFGGIIVNKYLMDTRQMTRKEYLHYTKGLKQSELLNHPLMYIMFRSEGQSQVNFFEWVDRFKK